MYFSKVAKTSMQDLRQYPLHLLLIGQQNLKHLQQSTPLLKGEILLTLCCMCSYQTTVKTPGKRVKIPYQKFITALSREDKWAPVGHRSRYRAVIHCQPQSSAVRKWLFCLIGESNYCLDQELRHRQQWKRLRSTNSLGKVWWILVLNSSPPVRTLQLKFQGVIICLKMRKELDQRRVHFIIPKMPQVQYFVSTNCESQYLGKNVRMEQALTSLVYLPIFQQLADQAFLT